MIKVLIADDQESWRSFHLRAVHEIFGDNIVAETAKSGAEGYSKILENASEPYDYVITDMQMENDYVPKMAGEWFIEQIQNIPAYYKTRIVIISASYNIKHIAERYNVDYIPKASAASSVDYYKDFFDSE